MGRFADLPAREVSIAEIAYAAGFFDGEGSISTAFADKFLRDIAPYLIVKREEAEIAISFRDRMFKNDVGRRGIGSAEHERRDELKLRLRACVNRRRRIQNG